jgi:hypothetical protein
MLGAPEPRSLGPTESRQRLRPSRLIDLNLTKPPMRPQPLFALTAALMLLFGAGFLFLPAFVFSLYGVVLDASGIMLAHVAGAAIFALGTLAWAVRNTADSAVIRPAMMTLFCFFLLKSAVTLLAQLTGVFNVLGWTILLIDIPLCLLYARALFPRGAAAARLA